MEIKTTIVYDNIEEARLWGFNTISCQGSSRSSKTYNILIRLAIEAMLTPNIVVSIVRKTLPALKATALRDFKEILTSWGFWEEKRLNKTDLIYSLPNGSIVEFFSTDDEQKVRGRKRHILFVNEANELDYLEYQQLKFRTSSYAILDYNPSFDDEHWISKLNNREDVFHFITTYKDNLLHFYDRLVFEKMNHVPDK